MELKVASTSDIQRKHLQLIELIWATYGSGERYYNAVQPKGVPYGHFVRRVTELICLGLEEGWAELVLPRSPLVADAGAYSLKLKDTDRFIEEICRLFGDKERADGKGGAGLG